ncbi:hypothetical protein MNY58_00610 [Staphylococcus edaphicus]|uniref:LXG domain-containing protein n=1 Tax=Staphylococcus edaphicus TaxID=1955013 RepID=A0ABY4QCD0_9STAP|nr:hypothetical protein [Staphylococcus edaphicus]UQW81649.1 hypothetical protein MNY58_00610 [Staphylococcus edaphicus]
MSIDMYLSKSKNQSSDVNKLSKDIKNGYDSVIKANSKFISETGLKGKAFDSGKEFFESIISPLLLSMKTLSDLTEQACQEFVNKYISEVDSQSLKESELEEDIRELEVRIAHLESMTISLKQKSSKNRTAINGNKNMISSLEHQKEELEKKLRKLRQFNQTSPAIF